MKKLLYILMLIPALLSAQTYNVSITNSLLGPVTLEFTNTQVTASGAVVTGTVINAAITNTFSASVTNEFSASVTNTFAPVNNITNEITVGGTTVNNTNTFISYITNDISVAGVVVTNNFSPVNNNTNNNNITITNVIQYTGTFTQNITTNNISQFNGVNVFTPNVTDTNVSGTWTITINTNAAVRQYTQVGNITQVTFSVTSTNDVALAEIILDGTTNSITWPTNKLVWAAGSAPTHTVSNNIFYFRAWRDYVQGVFVTGTTPP